MNATSVRGALAALFVLATLAACDGDPTSPDAGGRGRLELRATLLRGVLYVNDTTRVRLYRVDGAGHATLVANPLEVTFTTVDPGIATADINGVVTGMDYGSTRVQARWSSETVSLDLRVAGTLHRDPVRASATWDLGGSPHVLESRLPVGTPGGTAVLTVAPGSTVLFRGGAGLDVGSGGGGRLVADGDGGAIRFEAEDSLAPAGTWHGVELVGPGASTLARVTVRQCGGEVPPLPPLPGCIVGRTLPDGSGPTVTLRDVTIRQGRGYGFVLEKGTRLGATSRGLTVEDVEGRTGMLPGSELPRFPYGGTIRNVDEPAIVVTGDTLRIDTEWADPGVPWILLSDLVVAGPGPDGPRLTLLPGLDVQLAYSASLVVGADEPGRLVAGAEGGPPVRLEYSPWMGGGAWGGVLFFPSAGPSVLTNVRLSDCGWSSASRRHSTCFLVEGDDAGGRPEVRVVDVEIADSRASGAVLAGGGRFADGSGNLVVSGAAMAPLEVTVQSAGSIPGGTYTGNGIDRIFVRYGPLRSDQTWRDLGLPYDLPGGLGLEDGGTLTLDPGVQLLLPPGGGVFVGRLAPGGLKALGTREKPVLFGSSLPEPFPGVWMGVSLDAMARPGTRLEHVVVDWAGGGAPYFNGAVQVGREMGPVLRDSVIRRSAICAVYRAGGGAWTTDFTAPELGNVFQENGGPDQCGS